MSPSFAMNFKIVQFSDSLRTLLVAVLACSLLYWYMQWKKSRGPLYKLAKIMPHPPHLSKLPLVGVAHNFMGNTRKILNNLHKLSDVPGLFACWLGHRLFIVINTPEHMDVVLNHPKCLKKEDLYRLTTDFGGTGLFAADVPTWKHHRKVIQPTFKQKYMDEFVTIFAKNAKICKEVLERQSGCKVNMFEVLSKFAVDTVCETALGVSINSQTTESTLERVLSRSMETAMKRMFNVFYHSDFIFNKTKLAKRYMEDSKYFQNFVNELITKKKQEYWQRKHSENNNEPEIIGKPFLDQLVQLSEEGANFTDAEIIGETSVFIIAGSDTTGTVGNFVLAMIAMHKEVERRVYEEVMEVVGPDRPVEYTDLLKLNYTEQVIKETLRLFPVGPFIFRMTMDDVQLDEYTLPKDCGLIISIFSIHRSPLYYKDPLKFDPERFSPEELAKRHRYTWLPFSGGPRNCIGAKYGLMVLKLMIATLVRSFIFETDYKSVEDIKLKQSIIIKSLDDIMLKIIPRK